MCTKYATPLLICLLVSPSHAADQKDDWWNPAWKFRTSVTGVTPYRDDGPRPVEVAIDFSRLLKQAGIDGEFDPASVRVVRSDGEGGGTEVPFVQREETAPGRDGPQEYLAWIDRPKVGTVGRFQVYFDTRDRGVAAAKYAADRLPPENLLANPGFEKATDGKPDGWTVSPPELVRLGRFAGSTGQRSLMVVVDENTPPDTGREVVISRKFDVGQFAGREMVFECDLLAQKAAYGAPVCIELEQLRADGSRIPEFAVQTRWLTLELAAGQLVQFCERGRFSHEATTVNLRIRMRCYVRDVDTRKTVTGEESHFTVWLDRLVVRPGCRWSWPAKTAAGFVPGALENAPLNRSFEFTGLRRVAFNGASEGTLTSGKFNPEPKSVHWGLASGTLEFWCRPTWQAEDGAEHVFFEGVAYGHRLQSRLRKLSASDGNQLEFTIADAGGKLRSVRGKASLKAGQWHHLAACWDFPAARLELFLDGQSIGRQGPHDKPWPSSLTARDDSKPRGIGISEDDRRSMPMQAFIGGDRSCDDAQSAEAALDEFRISDVARYAEAFTPPREEFALDEHTRALFHFENASQGVHDSDDRFVEGHLACELPRVAEEVPLDVLSDNGIDRRTVSIRPPASSEAFQSNRVESRLTVTRPADELPDPRFVECRPRQIERTVKTMDDEFSVSVGGDFEPLMHWITFALPDDSSPEGSILPRWRANDNVVSLSYQDLAATLAPGVEDEAQKAHEIFRHAVATSNYYDASICETLPTHHRARVSYSLIKALNIYAFDQCGPLNYTLRKLFLAGGISSNDASGTHHQFQQAFYDGDSRLFDLSPRKYWLLRDNQSVASRRQFEDDLYLKLRQGDKVNSGIRGRRSAARFGSAERPHDMNFPLRPGERAFVSWHNRGRWIELTGDRQPLPPGEIPPYFGNGSLVFRPVEKTNSATLDNITLTTPADAPPVIRPTNPSLPAALVYRARCPYVFSDGQILGSYTSDAPGAVRVSLSFDEGKTWTEVWRNQSKTGELDVSLIEQVPARFEYWIKLQLMADSSAAVSGIEVRSTFICSPLALPGKLSPGKNRIRFAGGPVTAIVSTTCGFVERYQSDLGVSLNSIGFYMNGDQMRRELLIAAGAKLPLTMTLQGRDFNGQVAVEGLPDDWKVNPPQQRVKLSKAAPASVDFLIAPPASAQPGEIRPLEVVVGESGRERRIPAQILVARAPLVRDAEKADRLTGKVAEISAAELSGQAAAAFAGSGSLGFDIDVPDSGAYALWLRARWEPDSGTNMTLAIDQGPSRNLSATAMIGFTDWTSPRRAHTKMFAHFGEQYGHWSWYRIPDVELTAGRHRLTLGATDGARFDAVILLPQNPTMDRAAMNLFQDWNYAPWSAPF